MLDSGLNPLYAISFMWYFLSFSCKGKKTWFSYLSNLFTFRLLVMEKPEDPGDLTPCFIITPQFKFWNLTALGNSSYMCLLRYPLYHLRTWKVYIAAPPFLFSQSTLICGMEVCFGFKMPSVSESVGSYSDQLWKHITKIILVLKGLNYGYITT